MGQSLLSVGALMLLAMLLLSLYRLAGESGRTLDDAQSGITALTLTTSYMEIAQRLEFDEITRTDTVYTDPVMALNLLTAPTSLGREPGEISMRDFGRTALYSFDDFDDFHLDTLTESGITGNNEVYRTAFAVTYVSKDSVVKCVNFRTPLKRLDMKIWRIFPPSTDTLRTSLFLGYWKFRI